MRLEDELKKDLENRKQERKNLIKATALFFSCSEEYVAPCKEILANSDLSDEFWSPEARAVFAFVFENSDLHKNRESYKALYHLIEKIESSDEIWRVSEHILWMTSFCLLAGTDKEVDKILEKAEKCDECREFMLVYTMQYLVMDSPLPPFAIYMLVHAGFGENFKSLIWTDLEGYADGMYWPDEPDDTPWKQLCEETNADNVKGFLEYVRKLKSSECNTVTAPPSC